MPQPISCPVLTDEGEKIVAKVRRVNQRWIVHGKLRDHAEAYILHLERSDPAKLIRACELALHLVHHKKAIVLRDPKPLFYAGLFAEASRAEIDRYLKDHPMTRAISLLHHRDPSGLAVLSVSGKALAENIAAEVRAEKSL